MPKTLNTVLWVRWDRHCTEYSNVVLKKSFGSILSIYMLKKTEKITFGTIRPKMY